MKARALSFPGVIPRPRNTAGVIGWLTTVDHKRIGLMYAAVSFIWLLVGGVEALLIRVQLSAAELEIIGPELYNQLFTMHGTTMVFLVGMPLAAAFFNLLVPLQIGARDVAFPRLNSLSLWVFVLGSILLNISWLTGEAPNGGWFGYSPNAGSLFNPGAGMSFWALGLLVLGVASVVAGLNFIVTIINMRAPGMTLFRMPIFSWMALITSTLIVLALPVLTVALIQLSTDRLFGTNFHNPVAGADPILWQHLFWLFGHPEVYILILPGMGIVSEIIPTFARKPLFGYATMVLAGAVIGFMGWFVWAHHMFTVGLGPAADTAFAISTMAIAVPTGIKIFNWLGTMWRGSISFTTPMLFAISFVALFTIGGLSGVMHAVAPSDAQQQDTYFVVAHFHYVLFGGLIMAIFGGIFFWWPKFFGWRLNEKWGFATWILMFIGFNLQFGPLHLVGLLGMPRRVFTYSSEFGWGFLNLISSVGGFMIALSVLVFIGAVIYSYITRKPSGDDPWDARSLEWSLPSPVPPHNFDKIPQIQRLDQFWYDKHPEMPGGKAAPSGGQVDGEGEPDKPVAKAKAKTGERKRSGGIPPGIHMPDLSYWPLVVAVGITTALGGLLAPLWVTIVGIVILCWGVIGWTLEPVSVDDHSAPAQSHERESKSEH